jgi:hypothetical protein
MFVWNPGFILPGEMVPNIEHLHLMPVFCIWWTFLHLLGKHSLGLRQELHESGMVIRITSLMDCWNLMGTNFYQIFVFTIPHFLHSSRTFVPPSFSVIIMRLHVMWHNLGHVKLGKIRITLFHANGITSNIKVHNHAPLRSTYVFAKNTCY